MIFIQQIEPWSTTTGSMTYVEPSIPFRANEFSRVHHLVPWRPNVGYENIEVLPL